MADIKLYLRTALTPGASDFFYLTRADGSADGPCSFTSAASVFAGVLSSTFAPLSHTHTASQVTDFSTASDARIAAAVGVTVQAYYAPLATYGGIAPSANVQTVLGAANYAAIRTALTLTVGTDVQAYSANLAAMAALSTTGKIYYLSAANTWTAVTVGTGLDFTTGTLSATGSGTVTASGSPTSGYLAKWTSASDLTKGDLSGDISTSGSLVTTIGSLKVATGMIQASAVTLAKIANASANSKLLGAGASGSGAAYAEITVGSGLTMTGTTLSSSSSAHAYEPFGALPLASTFTGVSNTVHTLTDGTYSLLDTWTASGANTVQLYKKAAPSTPYDVYMRTTLFTGTGSVNVQHGLVVRNASSGKLALFAMSYQGFIGVQEWTNTSTFSSQPIASTSFLNPYATAAFTGPFWLRINNDGTTLTFYWSRDGSLWVSLGTRTLATFLGSCDEIGFGGVPQSVGNAWISSFGTTAPA